MKINLKTKIYLIQTSGGYLIKPTSIEFWQGDPQECMIDTIRKNLVIGSY